MNYYPVNGFVLFYFIFSNQINRKLHPLKIWMLWRNIFISLYASFDSAVAWASFFMLLQSNACTWFTLCMEILPLLQSKVASPFFYTIMHIESDLPAVPFPSLSLSLSLGSVWSIWIRLRLLDFQTPHHASKATQVEAWSGLVGNVDFWSNWLLISCNSNHLLFMVSTMMDKDFYL